MRKYVSNHRVSRGFSATAQLLVGI